MVLEAQVQGNWWARLLSHCGGAGDTAAGGHCQAQAQGNWWARLLSHCRGAGDTADSGHTVQESGPGTAWTCSCSLRHQASEK